MWLLFAVLCLSFYCFMSIWNQHARMPALQLNLWRCLYISVLFGCTLPFVDFPTHLSFYISAVIAGVASMVVSTTLFYSAKERSAHLASLFTPLGMVFTYMAWFVLDDTTWQETLDAPITAIGVFGAMVIANVTVFTMRKIKFTHTSFMGLVLLNAVMIAASQLFVKETTSTDLDAVLVLSFIIFVVQSVCSAAWMKLYKEPLGKLYISRNLVVLCVVSAVSCICSWYAVILAPNPAYAGAVLLTAPFILTLYHRYHDHDISESLLPGTVITLCSLVIVFLSF